MKKPNPFQRFQQITFDVITETASKTEQYKEQHLKRANPLKRLRSLVGHTQFDLKVYTGISQSRLSRLENCFDIVEHITLKESQKLNEYFNELTPLDTDLFIQELINTNQTRG